MAVLMCLIHYRFVQYGRSNHHACSIRNRYQKRERPLRSDCRTLPPSTLCHGECRLILGRQLAFSYESLSFRHRFLLPLMMSFVNSKIPTVMVPRSQVQKRSKRMETVSICNVKRTVRFRQEAFGKTYQVTYATHWLLCNTSQNEGRAQECAATSLLERMVKDAKDPEYMEDVIRNTLGSMYAGKYHFGFIFSMTSGYC